MLKSLWDAVKDLQNADKQLAEKVNQIEVLVAGEYATREDFKSLSNAIFTKLDRIEDKLDAKVDK
jgi:CHASE3 domain sensor protein